MKSFFSLNLKNKLCKKRVEKVILKNMGTIYTQYIKSWKFIALYIQGLRVVSPLNRTLVSIFVVEVNQVREHCQVV
jgi:hypothetical protein